MKRACFQNTKTGINDFELFSADLRKPGLLLQNKIFQLLLLVIMFAGCGGNPLNVDVSTIDIKLEIKRLDHDIYKVDSHNLQESIAELKQKYSSFFDTYNENVIAIGDPSGSFYLSYLKAFLNDTVRVSSRLKIDSVFSDLTNLENELESAFRHYRYYFPKRTIPQIITMISGFNQSVVLTNEAIGISLDNYLGADCPFYVMLGLPEYKRQNMYSDKIPTDVLYAWAISEFDFDESRNNLISNMIYQGKIIYFLDAMFPKEPDYLKIGFRPEKLEWCKNNESGMWTFLVEHKLLFNTDRMNIVRFVNPAPFTSNFSPESPGRTGVWLGWQIVRKYMKKNPGITLPGLMSENDYQKILNDSGYSPEY